MFGEFEQLLAPMNDGRLSVGTSNYNSAERRSRVSFDSKNGINSSKNMYIMSKKQLNIPTAKKVSPKKAKASPGKGSTALNSTFMLRSSLIGNYLMNAFQKKE